MAETTKGKVTALTLRVNELEVQVTELRQQVAALMTNAGRVPTTPEPALRKNEVNPGEFVRYFMRALGVTGNPTLSAAGNLYFVWGAYCFVWDAAGQRWKVIATTTVNGRKTQSVVMNWVTTDYLLDWVPSGSRTSLRQKLAAGIR